MTAASFVPTTSIVTAIQFTGSNADDVIAWSNNGKDPAQNAVVVPNGTNLFVLNPGQAEQTAHATDWIVQGGNGSLTVHTNADFQANFVAK